MKKKALKFGKDIIFYLIGSFIYSSAVTMLISPNKISPGGITGIATALDYLFSLPSGPVLLILNIPILILGFVKFGGIFIIKTSFVTLLCSLTLTLTDIILPTFNIDKILASVFGGMLIGLGISLIMLRGATTGGIDIIAKLLNRKFRHLTVGKLILLMDAIIILIASIVYRNIETALYSVISMYASSRIMDLILYGGDTGKLIYVITSHTNEVSKDINLILGRGVTILSAKGAYTNIERQLILCSVRRHEVSAVYDIIDKYDQNAFIIVSDAGEIIGEGFKSLG